MNRLAHKFLVFWQVCALAMPAYGQSTGGKPDKVKRGRPGLYWHSDYDASMPKKKNGPRNTGNAEVDADQMDEDREDSKDDAGTKKWVKRNQQRGEKNRNNKTTYDEKAERGYEGVEPPNDRKLGEMDSPSSRSKPRRGGAKKLKYWIPICFLLDPQGAPDPNKMVKTVVDNFAKCDVVAVPYFRTLASYPSDPDTFNDLAKQWCNANQGLQVAGSAVQGHVNSDRMADVMCARNEEEKKKTEVAGCSEVGNGNDGNGAPPGTKGVPAASIIDRLQQSASTHELGHSVGTPRLGGDYLVNVGDGEARKKNPPEMPPQGGEGLEYKTKGGGGAYSQADGSGGEGAVGGLGGGFTPIDGCKAIQGGANINDRNKYYYPNRTKFYRYPHRSRWIDLAKVKPIFSTKGLVQVAQKPHTLTPIGGRGLAGDKPAQKEIQIANPFPNESADSFFDELADPNHRRQPVGSLDSPEDTLLRSAQQSNRDTTGEAAEVDVFKESKPPAVQAAGRNKVTYDESAKRPDDTAGGDMISGGSPTQRGDANNKLTYDETAPRGGTQSGGNGGSSEIRNLRAEVGSDSSGVTAGGVSGGDKATGDADLLGQLLGPSAKEEVDPADPFQKPQPKAREVASQSRKLPGRPSQAIRESKISTEIFSKTPPPNFDD